MVIAYLTPDGIYVEEAYNRELSGLSGGYPTEHSDVHLWYHGTIDTFAGANDGEQVITEEIREEWWEPDEWEGANTGFRFSRLGNEGYGWDLRNTDFNPDGEEARDGYSEYLNGNGLRQPLNKSSAVWPNIVEIKLLDASNNVLTGYYGY